MTALQIIIKEAKSLRAKNPKKYKKWTDFVKEASKNYSSKNKGIKKPINKKKVVKKKITKKVVKKTIGKKRIVKKTIAKKPTEKVILKKVHAAKTTSKNLFNKLDKLDEAQHKHMFGKIGNISLDQYKQGNIDLMRWNNILNSLEKEKMLATKSFKPVVNRDITSVKKHIKELKIHLKELKKLI
tara:strand:+ start:1841 stop:2392 length:552 start_codon:yes stop_codon:yes gene_type:complete